MHRTNITKKEKAMSAKALGVRVRFRTSVKESIEAMMALLPLMKWNVYVYGPDGTGGMHDSTASIAAV